MPVDDSRRWILRGGLRLRWPGVVYEVPGRRPRLFDPSCRCFVQPSYGYPCLTGLYSDLIYLYD